MLALRFIPPLLSTFLAATALGACVLAEALARLRPARTLREDDLTDWLKRDVGLLDGRDTAARQERAMWNRAFPR